MKLPRRFVYLTINMLRVFETFERCLNSSCDLEIHSQHIGSRMSMVDAFEEIVEKIVSDKLRERRLPCHIETKATPMLARLIFKDPVFRGGLELEILNVIEPLFEALVNYPNSYVKIHVVGQLLQVVVSIGDVYE